jgi:hypothetical protein
MLLTLVSKIHSENDQKNHAKSVYLKIIIHYKKESHFYVR